MKILLLQLKRIGDLILTSPAISSLREGFPDAHITLITDASCQGLVAALDVDKSWSFHRSHGLAGHFGFGPNAWIKTGLMGMRADYCLDFTGTDRSAWLASLSGSKKRVTFERFRKKFLRNAIFTDFVESSVRDRHTSDHYTDLLQPLGLTRKNVPLDLRIPEDIPAKISTLLAGKGISCPYAVLHAGTARAEKYWLSEHWACVIDFLHTEYGLISVLTGSSEAGEQQHIAAIKNAARHQPVDLTGKTNLLELAAVIQGARIFCGVDTAAMHLADAMLTPAVALFGPTNPFHWLPRHTRAVVLRTNTAAPYTPTQKGGPMEQITPEMVEAALRSLLAS